MALIGANINYLEVEGGGSVPYERDADACWKISIKLPLRRPIWAWLKQSDPPCLVALDPNTVSWHLFLHMSTLNKAQWIKYWHSVLNAQSETKVHNLRPTPSEMTRIHVPFIWENF